MITSAQNPLLKEIKRLQRKREGGRFVAEGEDLVAAADAAGWRAVHRLEAGIDVEPALLDGVSALGSGTRVLAVYEQRWAEAPVGPLALYLHGVGDPGNVGTILRGALAFGAGSVVLGPGCADPYGGKAVRASMGALFSVPVVRAALGDCPAPRIALVAREGAVLRGTDGAGTLVVGAERTGLPDEVVAGCEAVAHIPIAGESLNAAMAATVALYEFTKRLEP
ncbi:MAG: methyltransferase [Solirubrobacterales bacterium]|jgi:TrmH family RNA methyltransferase|nr:methyltransferase [Solirubrobacterales bacterium]